MTESLDRSMTHAVAWNAAARWATQLFTWASTIVVARLLTPYDYGLVGMAGLYLSLATLVSQTGVEDAIIALSDLGSHQLAELNTVAMLIGLTLVGLSCALAPALARFFSAPPLTIVVIVASSMYIVNAFQVVPRALLKKALRFKLLAGIQTTQVLCQMVVTILLAWLGFRYWSLVFGTIASCVTATILLLCWRRHGFAVPHFRRLGRELKYTGHVLVSGITWYAYDNSDFAVAGRVLGAVPLGNYTVAWNVGSAPVEKITNLVTGVTPAFFSAVQNDKPELRRYLLRLTEILALFTLPASVGIALTADYLVPVLFGPKWYGAIGPLRLLGIFFSVRSLVTILPNLLTAIRDARFVMWSMIAAVIAMPVAFVIGSRWGTTGIAAAWVVAYPPLTIPLYWRVFRKTEMRAREYLSAVMPALSASAVMASIVVLARVVSPFKPHSLPGLCFLVLAGGLSYVGALLSLHYQRVLRVIRALKRIRSAPADTEQPTPVSS